MIDTSSVFGVDVSKSSLDVAFGLGAPVRAFPNEPKGHRAVVRALRKHPVKPTRIVIEATGGYEVPLLKTLAAAGLPVIRVNPRQVRDFARAAGVLAKTDAIDASVLVRFGAAVEPIQRRLPAPEQERLCNLHRRRAQLVQERTAEANRLQQVSDAFIKRTISAVLRTIEQQIELIKAESAEVIKEHERLRRQYDVLTSVPGVGPVTAAVIMGQMPEIGTLSRQAVAALAGLAPFNKDSGTQRGQRHIRGGRSQVRDALYMATLTAAQHNPVIREDFERFTAAGKPHKVAMTACMRKLLTILNALVRDDMLWGEKKNTKEP